MKKYIDKPTEIDSGGNKFWKNDKGQFHRIDGPAVEWASGYKAWYINGKCHRIDGPAVEYANGRKSWYIDGKFHRIDGPAIEWSDGRKSWYIDGKQYSEEEFNKKIAEMNKTEDKDKPTYIDLGRNKFWKNDKGLYHREDGPAVEFLNGHKEWYLNGRYHRLDGPAIVTNRYKEWFIDGQQYSEEEFNKKVAEMNKSEGKDKEHEDELTSLKKRLEQLEQIIKEKDKIIEDKTNQTSLPQEETLSKKIQPTTELLSNVGVNSMKLVGARQTSRALVGLVRFMLITIANKMGKSNYIEFIDSEPGKVMLEILAPLVIHSLSANKFFPKYTEQIEAVSKLSVEANITYYSLHYSDKISDLGTEILSNKETREQIKNLINLGSNIIGSEKDMNLSFQHNLDAIMA